MKIALLPFAGTLLLAAAGTAYAQAPAAPAAPAQPAPAAPGAPAPVTMQSGGGGESAEEEADAKGRLWIGFNVGGGVGTGANLSGPALNVAFRAGWVFNHQMAVYGNLTAMDWIGSSSAANAAAGNASIGAIAGILITPMFAFNPADIFEVAAGPSLDYLSGGGVSVSSAAGSVSAGGFSSVYFGAQGRLALHLGGRNAETHRRRGFTLSADIHPSFVPGGPVTFITGGLGADWF